MENFAKLIGSLSGFVWPGLIMFFGWRFRKELSGLSQLLRRQLASGAAIKWKDFEFKGMELTSFDARDGTGFQQEQADKEIFDRRHAGYNKNKNLFLVHRVRPTGKSHPITSLPTYDVSVYVLPHKNFGHLNDIREVQYYFGQHFGLRQSMYGTKYVVQNGSDNFAVRVNAYGPMLCEARIIFHDGTEATVSRYLDFEGTDYRFSPETNAADAEKIRFRQEA
jgi:hypothetical protein